ncbi:Fe(3+)-hydroxamate ABC transporter substrate-binding protein FhuD [uncultured Cedecea sp.]|uniref:Fe(3+)-hydroxamate ABC transporter substrate-binding protein FhuD n=1 Tax=uncultured Cedecea sp. TaxID=988762 RepID=UPI00263A25FA|nr:Fe(3+)-hydroxamate ABC transporter substrate-binding protein FhuD [uncultured Cedecea sp.]
MHNPSDLFLTRRRLLAALALSPVLFNLPPALAALPDSRRIIALEWLPIELLMALGITPMAVADRPNYQIWVNEPKLPDSVIDIGLRTEPNLEFMAQLKPSLIVYSAGYGPSEEKIKRIAPGMGFPFNDASGKPLDVARRSLTELGDALGMQHEARRHLSEFDAYIESMKPRFANRGSRPLLLMSFLDNRHVLVVGKHSLFQQIMDLLGLENAWLGETNFWGTAIVGIERLAEIKGADVLCLEHNDNATIEQATSTPLWRAMPFIREGRFQRVPAVWLYGATLSSMHFTRVLDNALGGKA